MVSSHTHNALPCRVLHVHNALLLYAATFSLAAAHCCFVCIDANTQHPHMIVSHILNARRAKDDEEEVEEEEKNDPIQGKLKIKWNPASAHSRTHTPQTTKIIIHKNYA